MLCEYRKKTPSGTHACAKELVSYRSHPADMIYRIIYNGSSINSRFNLVDKL